MIYSLLKIVSQLALKVYFRKIHVKGVENIPTSGPYLMVANHPSSFLDPICIASFVNQRVSFLAKGSMFANRFISKLLTGLNMVPIYRAQDDPKMLKKNHAVFSKCYQKLSDNGVLLIFPEGTSEQERKLRKVKTGAARIALGCAKANHYNLNVKIIPVGLNYTKSSKFRSELFIQFGETIETDNYIEDFKIEEHQPTKSLTLDIEQGIKKLIIDIDEYELLVERVESLFKNQLLSKKENQNSFNDIKASQEIYNGIKHFQLEDAPLFHEIKTKIDDYFLSLDAMGISDKTLGKAKLRGSISLHLIQRFALLFFGFPIWLFGYFNSFIPYKLPRAIALKITTSEAFYGALLFSIGTFTFTLSYGLITLLVWQLSHSLLFTLCYSIALPTSGFFTIFYARIARRTYYNMAFYMKFFSEKNMMFQLISDRTDILKQLEGFKNKYQKKSC